MRIFVLVTMLIFSSCSDLGFSVNCEDLSPTTLLEEIQQIVDPIYLQSDSELSTRDIRMLLDDIEAFKAMSDECQTPPDNFSTLGLSDEEINDFIEARSGFVDISVHLSWILLDFDYLSTNNFSASGDPTNWREKYSQFLEDMNPEGAL